MKKILTLITNSILQILFIWTIPIVTYEVYKQAKKAGIKYSYWIWLIETWLDYWDPE